MTKLAFTLAEVLITIAIIGIVSALTLPSIINNVQRFVLKNQFIVNHSLISQAVRKTEADLEYVPQCWYWDNEKFYDGISQGKFSECKIMKEFLLNNLKIIKKCENNSFANGCIPDYKGWDNLQFEKDPNFEAGEACSNEHKNFIDKTADSYVLSNGSIIINLINVNNGMNMNVFALDVNGKKGPNKWGYDLFELAMWSNNGKSVYIRHGVCQPVDKGGNSVTDILTGKD